MVVRTHTEVRARNVPIADIEAARMLAYQHGFSHMNADVVRFAIALAAEIQVQWRHQGRIAGLDIPKKGRSIRESGCELRDQGHFVSVESDKAESMRESNQARIAKPLRPFI